MAWPCGVVLWRCGRGARCGPASEPALQLDVTKLIERAGLPEHSTLVGVGQEGHEPARHLAPDCQYLAGHDPLRPRRPVSAEHEPEGEHHSKTDRQAHGSLLVYAEERKQ